MTTSTSTHYRSCPLCEASCGLSLTVDGEQRVTRIAGDAADSFSRGFICPKGAALHHLHEDRDRLPGPQVRRGDDPDSARWESVSWEEAFAEVERRLTPIMDAHGRDAVAAYLGNPNTHNPAAPLYIRPLLKALGTRNIFSASTVDQMPKHVSSGLLFGDSNSIPVPDLDRTDLLLMLGANPWESNGSLCTAPDFPGRLRSIQDRGGRFVVVDPRRTRTAEHADEHIPIRPGTDALLLLGMLQVVCAEGLVRLGRLEPLVQGMSSLHDWVRPFSPDKVAPRTGVPAATIARLARALAQAERAVVYGRLGTHTVESGTVAAWAVDVLNLVTGHLDEPGGAMWPLAAHQRPGRGRGPGFSTGRYHSRVRQYPEVRGEFPVATLADEIATPGQGQVKALVTVAGNPVLSTPDSGRLDRVLRQLSFMVSVDPYRNETTRHAHVILPPPPPLSRSHFELAFAQLAVRNVVKWSPALLPPRGPSEAEILARLSLIAGGQGAAADPALVHTLLERGLLASRIKHHPALTDHDVDALRDRLWARAPEDRCYEVMVRLGAYGDQFGQVAGGLTLEQLSTEPHGVDLGPLRPRLPELLRTASGMVEVATAPIGKAVAELAASLETARPEGFVLIGRRDLRWNNSWMHNVPILARGRRRCTLHMHPQDAAELGLSEGQTAHVASRVGRIAAPVEVTDSIMRGVVSLPHGFGHDLPNVALSVAAANAGVNTNVLTDPERLDSLSGNAVLNGIPIRLSAHDLSAGDEPS